MRQRVAFARAVLAGGELLLLDEPFGALDALTRLSLQRWLAGMCAALKLTCLLVTHDLDEALLLADRVYVSDAAPRTHPAGAACPSATPAHARNALHPRDRRAEG